MKPLANQLTNQPATRPDGSNPVTGVPVYGASWLDHFFEWIRVIPLPTWLCYLSLWLLLFLLFTGLAWLAGVQPAGIRPHAACQRHRPACHAVQPALYIYRRRDGHLPYVGYMDETAVTYGWVATRQASIGELNLAFPIAAASRYLWDFATLPEWQGRGLYPRLLQGGDSPRSSHNAGGKNVP
jgi:hypothetical protein